MACIVYARVTDQAQELALTSSLVGAGIPRESIKVIESDPEHRPSPVQAGSVSWGLLGGLAGAAVGWFVMTWWSSPFTGILWGAVIGGICGGYPLESAAGEPAAEAPALHGTQIQIDTADDAQSACARRICTLHGASAIMVVGLA